MAAGWSGTASTRTGGTRRPGCCASASSRGCWKPSRDRCSTTTGENLDPHKIWATMMTGEKPGGHGERSVAVGVDRHGRLGRGRQDRGRSRSTGCWPIATATARSTSRSGSTRPAATTSPARISTRSRTRCAAIWRLGYTTVKMKIGGAPLAEDLQRIEAVLEVVGAGQHLAVDANGRFDLRDRDRLRRGAGAVRAALVRGGGRSARLRAAGRAGRTTTTARWRPARTSSRCRMPAT